jgi:hypothetical protein
VEKIGRDYRRNNQNIKSLKIKKQFVKLFLSNCYLEKFENVSLSICPFSFGATGFVVQIKTNKRYYKNIRNNFIMKMN